MNKNCAKNEIKVLGIDIGKQYFHLHGIDGQGNVCFLKILTRKKLLQFMVKIKPCLVGMEACGGSHYWTRNFWSSAMMCD